MKSRLAIALLALLLVAAFCALGRWQLRRAVEKQAMLDQVAQVLRERDPRPLAPLSREDATTMAWTAGGGEFTAGPALLLDNQRLGDAVGVHVYRVFQPQGGRALLVDLGWLPLPPDRRLPKLAAIAGPQNLRGLLLAPPASGLALGPAFVRSRADAWLLTRIDTAALSQALGLALAPRVLRPDPSLALGYVRNLDVLPNTLPPERHRGYALQWFGLAALTFVFSLIFLFRVRRP